MINITNQNRENQNIWFEKESDNLYTIHTTSKYALNHACINYEPIPDDAEVYDVCWNGEKRVIYSFDPSGGPYMSVGHYEINGKRLSRIFYKDNKFYFQTS